MRGYLAGSGWKDYQRTGAVCGHALPAGLRLADALPEPIFTPATKAAAGAHDENIDYAAGRELVGAGARRAPCATRPSPSIATPRRTRARAASSSPTPSSNSASTPAAR